MNGKKTPQSDKETTKIVVVSEYDFWIVVALMAALAIPISLALGSIDEPLTIVHTSENPSPYGYTWSLLIFIIPCILLGAWWIWDLRGIRRRLGREYARFEIKTFLIVLASMASAGVILDLFLGFAFFRFPNPGATLGIRLPSFDWQSFSWALSYFPIEEFIFYLTGNTFILLSYMWAKWFWLSAYGHQIPEQPYARTPAQEEKETKFHYQSLVIGLVFIAGAILYKKLGPHQYREGFPFYFVFLMAAPIASNFGYLNRVRRMTSWRALSFTLTIMTFVSLLWEVTLGLPYGWWGYKETYMVGIFIKPWSNLPLEAVIMWIAASWAGALHYESRQYKYYFQQQNRSERLSEAGET